MSGMDKGAAKAALKLAKAQYSSIGAGLRVLELMVSQGITGADLSYRTMDVRHAIYALEKAIEPLEKAANQDRLERASAAGIQGLETDLVLTSKTK